MSHPFAGTVRGRLDRWLRRQRYNDSGAVWLLGTLTVILFVGGLFFPVVFPFSALLLPMFLGSLWIGPRRLPWFVIFVLVCTVVLLIVQPAISWRTVVRALVSFAIAFAIMISSFRRTRLGVTGVRGESMLADLRERISSQSQIPDLPEGWYVDSVVRSSEGTAFAGDFVVASRTGRQFLELVVVDVSGKGIEAGVRSLFLSGALNGILVARPGPEFLPFANDYLVAQEWEEGFATAVHLHLDLETGAFELRKAGHPPPVWLHAGSGRWSVLESDGAVLGLIPDTEFETVHGVMEPGDGLLLYTDGLVETSERDIASGIDRLAGAASALMSTSFSHGAHRVLDALPERDDDQALLVVHRL